MRALERTISILEAVAAEQGECSATVAAQACGLPLSTTARLMHQLAEHGLLVKDARSGAYVLGPRIFRMAEGGLHHLGLREIARPYLAKLRDATGETVALHVRTGSYRVCVDVAASHHAIARLLRIGDVNPLVGSATGEVLLAGAPPSERKQILDEAGLDEEQRRTVEDRLEQISRDRIAISMNRWAAGVGSVAVPIDRNGVTVTVLNVSGPVDRLTPEKADAVIPELKAAAATITSLL